MEARLWPCRVTRSRDKSISRDMLEPYWNRGSNTERPDCNEGFCDEEARALAVPRRHSPQRNGNDWSKGTRDTFTPRGV